MVGIFFFPVWLLLIILLPADHPEPVSYKGEDLNTTTLREHFERIGKKMPTYDSGNDSNDSY